MDSKGFSLLEVAVASFIMVVLMVPALQGTAGAYRAYRQIQAELSIIENTKLMVGYYQELYHGEAQTIDSNTVANLNTDASTLLALANTNLIAANYTRNVIGPPTSTALMGVNEYYLDPIASKIYIYDTYLVAWDNQLDPDTTGIKVKAAIIVTAYYQDQI